MRVGKAQIPTIPASSSSQVPWKGRQSWKTSMAMALLFSMLPSAWGKEESYQWVLGKFLEGTAVDP